MVGVPGRKPLTESHQPEGRRDQPPVAPDFARTRKTPREAQTKTHALNGRKDAKAGFIWTASSAFAETYADMDILDGPLDYPAFVPAAIGGLV